MGLPQVGKDVDGSLIERTDEETELFLEALPAMSTLYSTFDVMVLPEVPDGMRPYTKSGWCFSEFQTALLMDKLNRHAKDMLDLYANESIGDGAGVVRTLLNESFNHEGVAEKFQSWFDTNLQRTIFFNEGDRATVHSIVQGFSLRRALKDAVCYQSLVDVNRLLETCRTSGLDQTLNEPVDRGLNTLLHLAAKRPSGDIVRALLSAGVRKDTRNLRGDTPLQLFAFPRMLSGGARAARSFLSDSVEV
eukprot:TRINITY_DN66310_c0_g1_i1.p1 TRINITY_DN66310_c0_g1~~TRINITY_DN66310_c0_g1_i1.p1  ORF type:complete len:267 (+),score=41.04 TRINITY_DN66310_c0_g1_i1:58-801(+)